MSEELYKIYINLRIFAEERRKFKPISAAKNRDLFRNEMQTNDIVEMKYENNNGKNIIIYILANNNKCNTEGFRKILSKINVLSDVIFVTERELKNNVLKSIAEFKHVRVKKYLWSTFSTILPNGPLCGTHRIMSEEEVRELLECFLFCHLVELPKIFVTDPQCIWIGAEVGDVLSINTISITGLTTSYRVVVPRNGRIVSFRDADKHENKEDHVGHEFDEDDELNSLNADHET